MPKAKTHRKPAAKSHAALLAAAKKAATKLTVVTREIKALKLKLKKAESAQKKAHAEHKKLAACACKTPVKKTAKKKTHRRKKTHHKKATHHSA